VNAIVHSRHWMTQPERAWMRRVPWCESRYDPYAIGGPNLGMWQFNRGTWAALPRRYSRWSPFSARHSSLAAAWMVRSGRAGEWACG
jgi:hypothetical protein